MSLKNKIDFALVVTVDGANPNGDPLNGNRPRTTIDGLGEISDVCVKRKIRNRFQDMGQKVFVQSDDRADDGFKSLRERADSIIKDCGKDEEKFVERVCEEWIDVRAFGQLFAFKGTGSSGLSISIRGPVSIRPAFSVCPVDVTSTQITKSVNSEKSEKKGSDTMGMKHRVEHGLYIIRGSINPQLASKTGFSEEDAEVLKEALLTLFVNDSSSARPDGSMDVVKMVWWSHNCPIGQYSTAKVHNSIKITPRCDNPMKVDDYDIDVVQLEGLKTEIF
ncbi:type I-C CRISPR-associated protein Cas7/Csd2 [Methanomethylophilus alvi]|uniref:type I-C CRISPR-associated protein Cas7/Csd2 n=1 Tax=Methanomethylophilus alvi TaxID=1291540 RepID=UPI0037DDD9A8